MPVLSMAEALQHPHNLARQTFVTIDGVPQPAPAPRFRGYSERPITSFMISLVPPKIRVTRASRHSRAIRYSFI